MRKKVILCIMFMILLARPVFASSLDDMKPGGGSTPNKNTQKYQGEKPNAEDLTKEAKKNRETVKDSYWDIEERDITIRVGLNQGTTRFEVFYSSMGKVPYIAFQTPDGEIYETGKDSEYIISREGNQIEGHSDLRYEVIYITAPSMTDGIKVKISLDSKTRDFMMVQSTVPAKWEGFKKEIRTNPEKLIIWGFHNSENTITDLIAIAENTDLNPIENNMDTAAPPVVEKKSITSTIIPLLVVAIIIVAAMIVYNNFDRQKKEKEARSNRINKKNKVSQRKKKMGEKQLDNVLDEFNDDYSDDDFFSEKPVGNDVYMPIEEKVAFVEDDISPSDKIENPPKPTHKGKRKVEDSVIDEEETKSQEPSPAPKQSSPQPTTKPAQYSETDDEDDADDYEDDDGLDETTPSWML